MIKNLLRFIILFLTIFVIFISYLSIFGIKTNNFNEFIKSQVVKKDSRIKIDLQDVYIKLNIIEGSVSLNTRDINVFINNENQKLSNVDLLIGLNSLIKRENKINKIIINSQLNNINNLLKFIRAYKINIPALYLENIITKGNIVYNITIDNDNNEDNKIKITGKIINTYLNILGKEKINNVNFDFDYNEGNLNIINLGIEYKSLNFVSEQISSNFNSNIVQINGDFKNKINLNLISSLLDYNFKDYLDDKILLSSKSNFNISLNKKFKIKDYKLESEINFDSLKVNLDNIDLKKYLTNFEKKFIFKKGKINLILNSNNKTKVKVKSKYVLNDKAEPKEIKLKYSKINSEEKYVLNIDLSEYELDLKKINFNKKEDEELFLNLIITQKKNVYELNNFELFNDKNNFTIKKVEFGNGFKIKDFKLIEANYYNNNNFLNDISIKKKYNNIELKSKNFDISSNIEESLKSTDKSNFFEIFKDLNCLIKIDISRAKLDNEHNLMNLSGKSIIKNNLVNQANLSAKFDSKNIFTYTKNKIEGKKVTTIFSDKAKPFVKKFDFIKGFEDGKLDYTSTEINENLSKSELRIYNFKLQDMPALTKLLSLASLQGIADLATGQGIRFNEFEMFFDNTKKLITINEIYALGPAISILMEGYVEKNNLVSLRGTLVPATTINKTIAKIPLLGEILVGDKVGEGVFGVSFKIKGPPDELDTRVNPIKTLTPRFITRTLDKIKKSK